MTVISNKANYVAQNASLASYGYGILSKGQKLWKATQLLGQDALALASLTDSTISDLFMQLQASFSLGGNASSIPVDIEGTCSNSIFNFGYLSHTFKSTVKTISQHPISAFARSFFFYKQTADFALATCQWAYGSRSRSSLLHHGVNTALAYIPVLIATSTLGDRLPFQLAMNVMTLGCLAFSIRQDIIHSANPKSRESSPSISLIKAHVAPRLQSLYKQFFK